MLRQNGYFSCFSCTSWINSRVLHTYFSVILVPTYSALLPATTRRNLDAFVAVRAPNLSSCALGVIMSWTWFLETKWFLVHLDYIRLWGEKNNSYWYFIVSWNVSSHISFSCWLWFHCRFVFWCLFLATLRWQTSEVAAILFWGWRQHTSDVLGFTSMKCI